MRVDIRALLTYTARIRACLDHIAHTACASGINHERLLKFLEISEVVVFSNTV